MVRIAEFIKSILAGMAISLGGAVYLSCENKYVGAFFFCVGLITVVYFGLNLYTGKVGYLLDNNKTFFIDTLLSVFGNALGCLAFAFLKSPINNVVTMVATKLEKAPLQVFFDGILCGVLIFICVDVFKKKNTVVAILFCVPTFILCGFEHSIADMFYIFNARNFSAKAFLFLLLVVLGNAVGGLIFPILLKAYNKLNKTNK